MITINKDSFKDAIKEGLVVVEFRKEAGCPNCEQMKPIIEQFEKDNPQIKVCIFPCTDGKDVPEGYQFRMFPGIFSFSNGQPIRGYSGLKSLEQMRLLYASPNDLKIASFDAQAQADFFKEELKGFNVGTSVPIPEKQALPVALPVDMPSGDPGEENCDSCQ